MASPPELHAKNDSRLPVWGVDSIFGSCGLSETSSSDGFSTSFGSELGSTGTETESEDEGGGGEEEDFIAELTRQMADYMLKDEDESFEDDIELDFSKDYSPKFMLPCGCGYEGKWCNCNASEVCYYDNRELLKLDSGNQTNFMFNDSKRPIEVYELNNQPSVKKQGNASRGKRAKNTTTRAESRLEHRDAPPPPPASKKGQRRGGGKGNMMRSGSGMQAVYLGRVGQGNDSISGGTGVFLPRGINQRQTEPKKKSGCSTVLIPVRVLQALQHHFNNMDNAVSASPNHLPNDMKTKDMLSEGVRHATDIQLQPTNEMNTHEMQLPQEWPY